MDWFGFGFWPVLCSYLPDLVINLVRLVWPGLTLSSSWIASTEAALHAGVDQTQVVNYTDCHIVWHRGTAGARHKIFCEA